MDRYKDSFLKLFLYLAFSLILNVKSIQSQPLIKVYLFYSETCKECYEIKHEFLPEMIGKYSSSIEIHFYEIGDISNYNLLAEFEKRLHVKAQNPPPTMFVEDVLLDGDKEIKSKFEETITQLINKTEKKPVELSVKIPEPAQSEKQKVEPKPPDSRLRGNDTSEKAALEEQFNYLGFFTVVGGGLLDGLNPCAFATIIILVLYLTFTGYRKIEILKAGLTYTFGIFIAYLLIGVGLLEFARQVKFIPWLSIGVNLFFASIAIILGFYSISDYFKIKKGSLKDISLQLPDTIKSRIKNLVWKKSGKNQHIINSFVIGFLIGVLEFPCTGQVYFPIILAIRELPHLRLHAFLYLLLYNVCFILPLIVVFILAYYGLTSDRLTKFLEQRAATVKLLTALLFFILATILIVFSI